MVANVTIKLKAIMKISYFLIALQSYGFFSIISK